MKLKKSLLAIILCIFTGLSVADSSKGLIDDVIQYFDNLMKSTEQFRSQNALIKSNEDLQIYTTISDKKFPLNKLSVDDKNVFISSLRFNEKGLTTFNYQALNKLTEAEVFQILSLFGAERTLHLIKPQESRGSGTTGGIGGENGDYKGYKCISRATCTESSGNICMHSC